MMGGPLLTSDEPFNSRLQEACTLHTLTSDDASHHETANCAVLTVPQAPNPAVQHAPLPMKELSLIQCASPPPAGTRGIYLRDRQGYVSSGVGSLGGFFFTRLPQVCLPMCTRLSYTHIIGARRASEVAEEYHLAVPQSRRGTPFGARSPAVRTLFIIGIVACASVFVSALVIASGSDGTPLSLPEAIRIGLDQDSALREAEIELEIARVELNAEFSTFLLPTVNMNLSSPSLTTGGWSGVFTGSLWAGLSLPIGSSSQLSGKLNVGWDPVTGSWSTDGWNVSYSQRLSVTQSSTATDSIDKRRKGVADAEAALAQARTNLVAEVSRSYARLLAATVSLEQAEVGWTEAKQTLERTQTDFDAGLVAETTLIKARIALLDGEITYEDCAADLAESQEQFFGETLRLPAAVDLEQPGFVLDSMVVVAEALLVDQDAAAAAVASFPAVTNAKDALASAEDTLHKSRLGIDPEIIIQAGLSEKGYSLGWSVALTLFAPTWSEAVDIARLQVELAEERLRSATFQAESSIRSSQKNLQGALTDIDRLPLEQERWALEEQVMRSKLEAGSISEEDWKDFGEQLDVFQVDVNERSVALFVALLECRNALGFPLEWEEWLE